MNSLCTQIKHAWQLIDKYTFFGALFALIFISALLLLFPQWTTRWVNEIKALLTDKLGVFYLSYGAISVIFVLFIAFSDMGKIKLGRAEDQKEFSTYSWSSMLFCSGIGATILYWGLIEWAYYYEGPPFELDPASTEAIKWAATYGIFHWGPIAWAIYLVPAVAISYFYHIRNQNVLKISQCLAPLIGEKLSKNYLGKSIDLLLIFGVLGGSATALGFVSPLITESLHWLFHFPNNQLIQLLVLLSITSIFSYSTSQGLQKGIKNLSHLNTYLAIGFLVFMLLTGPTLFILDVGFESLGRSITYLAEMMTWNEAFARFSQQGFQKSNFPQKWTIFYWAWWLVFSPTIGLFVAKISRGRTLREVIIGALFFGSLGCASFFIILGNYGLYLQLTNQVNVIGILNHASPTEAILNILNTLPFAPIAISIFTILAVVFAATSFDTVSYILASVVQKELKKEPMRWNRLFWAFALGLIPSVLLLLHGDLNTLQAATIISAAPLLVVMLILMVSTIRAIQYDLHFQRDYSSRTIHIQEIPDIAPWQEGKPSRAPEGSILHRENKYAKMKQTKKRYLR